MKVGLFIPCFIDALFPEVGVATLELLERFGLDVVYPTEQTCCGQPMANNGFETEAAGAEALFARNFEGFDYIVGPSGSCVHHIRNHLTAIEQTPAVLEVRARTYELIEFLHDVLKVDAFPWARFAHKVGLHNSCGTLRALGHAKASETRGPDFSKPRALLSKVEGLELVAAARPDAGRRRDGCERRQCHRNSERVARTPQEKAEKGDRPLAAPAIVVGANVVGIVGCLTHVS